ncbi:hypothetical protein NC651_020507 [Populus alba x Populus x berolinensis]|nr:hypothetical protein NC651_020507 [Populus alba x Populus x berolinensis]
MALVQKLKGFSRSINKGLDSEGLKSVEGNNHERKRFGRDDIESSSISTEENCHWAAAGGVETVMSPILKALNTPYFADVPLFNQPFYYIPFIVNSFDSRSVSVSSFFELLIS